MKKAEPKPKPRLADRIKSKLSKIDIACLKGLDQSLVDEIIETARLCLNREMLRKGQPIGAKYLAEEINAEAGTKLTRANVCTIFAHIQRGEL